MGKIGVVILASVVSGALSAGCATSRPAPAPPRAKPKTPTPQASPKPGGPTASGALPKQSVTSASQQEDVEFKQLSELYARSDFEGTVAQAEAFLKAHPRSPFLPQTRNLAGLSLLMLKRPAEAINQFKAAVQGSTKAHHFNQHVLYNLARAQFEAGQIPETEQTISNIDTQVFDKDNQIKLHHLRANVLLKRSLPQEAAREALIASRLISPSQVIEYRPNFTATLDQAIRELPAVAPLEDLYREFEDSPFADLLLFRLGMRQKEQGDIARARGYFENLMSRFPESPYYAEASSLMAEQQHREAPVDHMTVGVLLPLKGKFGKFGTRSLQGIELAFQLFGEGKSDSKLGSKITLAIEDSGEDADQALQALNRLVENHHAAAVIGPLLTKGIEQISRRAQELHVPLISLARQEGPPTDYVLPAGITLRLQAQELARYAIQNRGAHRFAILAPKDKVGEEFTQYFWSAVESLGGQVTGVEAYNPGETDFRQSVDKLSGLYYTEARHRELSELARTREENRIRKRTRKTEQYFSLPPIVDYDAVFIPDEPKVAGQILPTFLYRDVENVFFLGPSAWNSPELPSRAQQYAEKAYFVEAFQPNAGSPASLKFTENYKEAFGTEPTAMDALAYDAAKLVELALDKTSSDATRADVLSALRSVKTFPGATGTISFKDGQFYRDLKILTVKGGQIVQAGP